LQNLDLQPFPQKKWQLPQKKLNNHNTSSNTKEQHQDEGISTNNHPISSTANHSITIISHYSTIPIFPNTNNLPSSLAIQTTHIK